MQTLVTSVHAPGVRLQTISLVPIRSATRTCLPAKAMSIDREKILHSWSVVATYLFEVVARPSATVLE